MEPAFVDMESMDTDALNSVYGIDLVCIKRKVEMRSQKN